MQQPEVEFTLKATRDRRTQPRLREHGSGNLMRREQDQGGEGREAMWLTGSGHEGAV